MTTGNIVYGDNYFPRPKDEKRIWRKIKQGNHIVLLAPRRVGKSSLLQRLKDYPDNDYVVVNSFVQACDTEKTFYKKLLKSLLESDLVSKKENVSARLRGLFEKFQIKFNIANSIQVETGGTDRNNVNREIVHHILLEGFNDIDKKVLITVDEFPDVLERIANNEGAKSAQKFLAGIRELCQDVELSKKVQFVFTGSIGLNTLAEKLQMTNLINTLQEVSLGELSHDSAIEFIKFYCDNNGDGIQLDETIAVEIIAQVDWNMPYYLALVCEELIDRYLDDTTIIIKKENVSEAINALFRHGSSTNFSHWKERLSRFEKAELSFAKKLLTQLSEKGSMTHNELFNLSEKPEFTGISLDYMLNCLKHDGYIFRNSEKDNYQFSSPLLKKWWQEYGR